MKHGAVLLTARKRTICIDTPYPAHDVSIRAVPMQHYGGCSVVEVGCIKIHEYHFCVDISITE